jgi:hypothetical protein
MLVVSCCLFPSISIPAQNSDSVAVLQAFRDSYNWSNHVAMHVQNRGSSTTTPESGRYHNFYFYNDLGTHQQTYGTSQELDAVTGKVYRYDYGPDEGRQFQTLYSPETGGYFLHEHRVIGGAPEAFDIYEAGEERNRIQLILPGTLGPILGHVLPFSKERLPDLLSPDNVTMREEMVDGQSALVVEATIPEGHIEVWLSPEKGYAMEKCRLTKVAGKDLGYDGQVYAHSFALVDKPLQTEQTIMEINVNEYQLIEGNYVPVQMDTHIISEWEGDEITKVTHSISISEITMNPDEEILDAFEFIVPEEARVRFRKRDGGVLSGFKWEDGKLVADVDADTLDANIRTAIAQLTTGKGSQDGKATGGVTLQKAGTAGRGAFLSKHGRLLTWISGALFLLACGAVGAFAYKSRKEKTNLTEADSPTDEEFSHASEGLEEHE